MSTELFSLNGKTILVIGAGGILGPAFCDGYAAAGANLVLIDRVPLDAQVDMLTEKHGVQCIKYIIDVRDYNKLQTAIDEIENNFGFIDVLHSNIAWKGSNVDDFFRNDEEYLQETWREIMDVNLDAVYFSTMNVGKKMLTRDNGSVILTGSVYGEVAPDQRIYDGSEYNDRAIRSPAVYSASKAGLIGLTKHLAALWGHHNIRVNCIVPGGVESGQNEIFINKYSERVPLGRMAKREEMVGAAIYLASGASSYVTGQVLAIDGGLTCW